ncbi:MAG: RHS repeat-associated core domain-containing protein, partial [Firmicutes bacterium]|nr:RHS repeat-associated core domain-containing protein [Bacillota bacterium]
IKFTGKDFDADIGLYYYNSRWYDQEVGRFISEDPVFDPNNFNEYTYCANNPLIKIDPSGNSIVDDVVNFVKGLFGWDKGNDKKSSNTNSNTNSNPSTTNTVNNGTVISDNGQITVKDSAGNVTATYNKEEMKADFQKLAQMQQEGAPGAKEFAETVKTKYKAFFDVTKDQKGGVSVIGLRGWGEGTKLHDTDKVKGEKNTYDDMFLVVGTEGSLDVFSRANFEGTTATGTYGDGNKLVGSYPSIADGVYELYSWNHLGKYNDLLLKSNNKLNIPTIGENPRFPERGNPGYATGIEIHRGGSDWTWSQGCLTIYAPSGDTSLWDRFISLFPTQPIGTKVGTLNVMTL